MGTIVSRRLSRDSGSMRTCIILILLLSASGLPTFAQAVTEPDVAKRARDLSTTGNFDTVVELLEPYVAQHLEDVEAWLLLAENQYWAGQADEARESYRKAIAHHPAHDGLRLAYARFLLESGELTAARRVLEPVPTDLAEAEALRGTIAWWSGRLTRAQNHFEAALKIDPGQPEAQAGFAAIRSGARPWVRVQAGHERDSQPLARTLTAAEVGLFATPMHAARADFRHSRFTSGQDVVPVTVLSGRVQSYWPALRLETAFSGGAARHADTTYWIGRLSGGIKPIPDIRLGVDLERKPYLYTEGSIRETVTTTSLQISAELDREGWLGQAVGRRERFHDGNEKNVVYAWLLVPLIETDHLTVQGGYAFGFQHTYEHRFRPVMTSAPAPNRPPTWEGRYIPYHTPINEQVHSATAAAELRWAPLSLRVGASYGLYGSEDAPFVYLSGPAPRTGIYTRVIHPWNARGGLSVDVSESMSVQLELSHMSTTWYESTSLLLTLYTRI